MNMTPTQLLVKKLRNGEIIHCSKCKEGIVKLEETANKHFPNVYCSNPKCKARINFN